MKFDVVTFGGCSKDVFFITTNGLVVTDPKISPDPLLGFRYGEKVIPERTINSFGGGAMNAAVNFSGFGLSVAAAIRVGSDETGEEILKKLKRVGVKTDLVERDKINQTGLSILISDKGEHIAFLERGSNNFLTLPKLNRIKAKWFYVSSLTGHSDKELEKIFAHAKQNDIRIAFNPGGVQLDQPRRLIQLACLADFFVVNREEAEELLDTEIVGSNDILAAGRKFLKLGITCMVITDGSQGSYYFGPDSFNFERAAKTKVVETTGAGDAFGSSFVAALLRGRAPIEAQKIATINSAEVVTKIGAQEGLLTYAEIEAKLRTVLIRD